MPVISINNRFVVVIFSSNLQFLILVSDDFIQTRSYVLHSKYYKNRFWYINGKTNHFHKLNKSKLNWLFTIFFLHLLNSSARHLKCSLIMQYSLLRSSKTMLGKLPIMLSRSCTGPHPELLFSESNNLFHCF